jgi:3-hydroxyacyl-[acyl-carrier-protein] dehydratase
MPPEAIFDIRTLDLNRVLVDQEGIRKVNPHRYEMEQLNAIVYVDEAQGICVGYKDVRPDEFWVRGHMPGYPLMPGVLMCEAAAQLTAYFTGAVHEQHGDFIAFSGLENVKFRGPVKPGDRLVLVAKRIKFHRRSMHSMVQGFVNGTMVFQGEIFGIPYSKKES